MRTQAKQLLLMALLAVVLAGSPATAQVEHTALTAVDFSGAEISQSGPRSFYIRNIVLPDRVVSLTLSLGGDGMWTITDVIPDDRNQISPGVVMELATITALDDTRLEIDGIIHDGRILSAVLSFDGEPITRIDEILRRGTFSERSVDYPETLRDLLLGRRIQADEAAVEAVRSEYENKLATLERRYHDTSAERDRLQSANAALQAQLRELRVKNEDLRARVAELSGDVDIVYADSIAVPQTVAAEYLAELRALRAEVTALREQIARLEALVESPGARQETGLRPDPAQGIEATSTDPTALRDRIRELERRNAKLMADMASLERGVRDTLLRGGFIAAMRPILTAVVLEGFGRSVPQLGEWRVENGVACQTDRDMLFGKLLLPLTQGSDPMLYSFEARSTDPPDEWVGFGLHVYADEVEKRGYGLGESLLVWLTRDRPVYRTDYTYLQLYRSSSDIHMGRVMDSVIPDPITGFVKVEVLYEPVRQYITISVDGEEKIRSKTWFGVENGVQIALRSLGTAEFRRLVVKSLP